MAWTTINMKPIHIHWVRVLPLVGLFAVFVLIIYALTRTSSCGTDYGNDPDIKAVSYLCNALNEGPANGDEGSVPTFKYRLEQVHVTIRHGDRFHLHTLPNYDMIHIPCNITKDVIQQVPEMEGYVQTLQESAKKMRTDHPFRTWDLYPNQSVCQPSYLTPVGAAQHVRNGAFLKSVYVRKWKLLGHGKELWEQVELLSTKKRRTVQSGLALLYGLLPEFDLGKLNVGAVNDNRICTQECDCPVLQRYINTISGVWGQWLPAFSSQARVRQFNKEVADVLGTPVHTLPLASHIMDVSVVHMCHGLPLPGPPGRSACFSPATVRGVIDAINLNGAARLRADPKVRQLARLKMHPFFQDLLARMEQVMSGKTKRRFFLYSGHDSTIDPLVVSLNVTDGSWPRYASRVIVELYSSAAAGGAGVDKRDYFVKVLYDGKDVTGQTRGCGQLAPDGLCRFAGFKEALDESSIRRDFGGKSYKQACSQNIL